MEITKGKIPGAKKTVVYGPEGIGKSTFASKFPEPVFIDTEGSTKDMDVARLPRPSSWQMLLQEIDYVKTNPAVCKTLVIDTIDWAEQLCVEYILAKYGKAGIEDFGYGNGYVYVKEEFGRFLNKLEDVIEAGVNVTLTAHAQMRKFEQPDELGAYDRYELKLGKKTSSQTSPLVKEWADMLLFANYKTLSVAVDDKGKKHKAQGGRRVMYTNHHPCWDAKNRYGLSDEIPFDYTQIAHILDASPRSQEPAPVHQPVEEKKPEPDFMSVPNDAPEQMEFNTEPEPPKKEPTVEPPQNKTTEVPRSSAFHVSEKLPKALRDLMEDKLVSEEEIQEVVGQKGYYPKATPILNYDPDFIQGVLVGAWPQVYQMIEELRKTYQVPFN
ncbi:ATP-binding protein [Muricomes intestini]|uniref:ATP-binding protein n=1 Tax=Muricomes intestini TaxID=1796634 RepID=UPI002FDD5986